MLNTEKRNERSTHIDQMDLRDALQLINDENKKALEAVDAALPQIEALCIQMETAIKNGHRIFYVGAGTSGRLGVLDASEAPPTYGVPQEMFTGIIAGGFRCLVAAGEMQEDDSVQSRADMKAAGVSEGDVLIGISASGGTPYVVEALRYAKEVGAFAGAIVNNPCSVMEKEADITIVVDSGPEVITGSTRMKAGTTQKVVLNMLSTMALVRCGYVYENMMINLKPSNIKLRDRMIRIMTEILDCDRSEAERRLEKADWDIKNAIKQEL